MKVLRLLKAAVICLLSHGAARKSCRECYEQIMEALGDTLVKSCNAEWIDYRSSVLRPTNVLQITFLEDVFSVTNGLCLLLQSGKEDFGAISRVVNSTLVTLEEMKEDIDSVLQKVSDNLGISLKEFRSLK